MKKKGMSAPMRMDHDYQAEDDFRTLTNAHEVRSDPARHSRAVAHGKSKIASMKKACSMKGFRGSR